MIAIRKRRATTVGGPPREGATTVEMAMVMPLFFLVVLGIVEFGRAMSVSQIMTEAAREGCREAILEGSTEQSVRDVVNELLTATLALNPSDVTVTVSVSPAEDNPDPNDDLTAAQYRDLCEVQVAVPFAIVNLLPANFLEGQDLTAHAAMRHE